MSAFARRQLRLILSAKQSYFRSKLGLLMFLVFAGTSAQAATLVVPAAGDFQAALNAAQPGDTIVLESGATFTGNFTLPVKSGASDLTVTSSLTANLPEGTRVSPAQSSYMAKILSLTVGPAVATVDGSHHWKFVGIEFTTSTPNSYD